MRARGGAALLTVLLAAGVLAAEESAPPAWDPFDADVPDALSTRDPHVVVLDGDFGAPLLLLHEPGAGPLRGLERDGLPLGTGHLWCDDPWTVSLAGLDGRPRTMRRTGDLEALSLRTLAADTAGTRLVTEWFKGQDESYLRRLAFRTPRAPWVLGFDFDERILHDFDSPDADPADFPAFPLPVDDSRSWGSEAGESKARTARTSVTHTAADGSRLTLAHERARKHKQTLPAFDLDRHEFWIDRTSADWRGAVAGGELCAGAVLNGSDLVLEPRGESEVRTIETARGEVRLGWTAGDSTWALRTEAATLALHDDAVGLAWAGADSFARDEDLDEGAVTLSRRFAVAGLPAELRAGAVLRSGLGAGPVVALSAGVVERGLRLELSREARAPGAERLWTPWTTAAPGWTVRTLPDPGLDYETATRALVGWSGNFAGLNLSAEGTVRRHRDGVGWALLDEDPVYGLRGRWRNGLEIDGWTAGLQVTHVREFAGRLRFEGRVDLRGWSVDGGDDDLLAVALPPERSAAAAAWWEHVWFSGDGILELGWRTEHRGSMSDPWLPDGLVVMPAATQHHALIMFRLTGADLGVALRNVTGSQVRLSSGAMSRGREMRWRLQWTLWH